MVKKKECYTKKKKDGGSYTTCVEGQKKPKRKTIIIRRKKKVVKKVAPKPKPTRAKKMSAGKSVLFTGGLMAKIGTAVITKPEIERRRIQANREKEKLQIKATSKLKSYITRIRSFRNKMMGDDRNRGSRGSMKTDTVPDWWEIIKANASTKKKMIKKTKDMKKKYDKLKAEVDNVGSNYTQYREVSEADKQLKQILKVLGP